MARVSRRKADDARRTADEYYQKILAEAGTANEPLKRIAIKWTEFVVKVLFVIISLYVLVILWIKAALFTIGLSALAIIWAAVWGVTHWRESIAIVKALPRAIRELWR